MKINLKKFKDLISEDGVFSDGNWIESKDQNQDGSVRLIQLADVGVGKFIDKSNRFMTEERANDLNCTYLVEGDILVARMPDPIGRACIFPQLEQKCVTVVDICIVRPASAEIDSRWLMHLINSKHFNNQVLQYVTGTTRQRISRGNLAKLDVEVPPLNEQKRIAAVLDKADAIRRKRQQAINLADDFLRSVFLDMFGDPVTNPKGWEMKSLKEVTLKLGSGSTPRGGKEAYLEEGISLIRSLNVHDNKFVHKDLAFISDAQADKLKNVVIEKDDLLLNITGASVCRATLVDNYILPARVNQHVCIIRAKTDKVLPTFLARLITSNSYKQKLMQVATAGGATREALTKQQVESLDIIVPPLEVQEKFESIVGKVFQFLKNSELQSKKPLFNSLSQKAFAGEL